MLRASSWRPQRRVAAVQTGLRGLAILSQSCVNGLVIGPLSVDIG